MKTSNAVEILDRRYVKGNKARRRAIEREKAKLRRRANNDSTRTKEV